MKILDRKSWYLFAIALLGITTFGYTQTTVNINASADTKLDMWATSTNYGSENNLQTYPWALSSGNYTRRILIKFDLSAIPAGATITQAQLHLYETNTRGVSRTLNAHRVTSSWSENTVNASNFNNAFNSTASAAAQLIWPTSVDGVWDLKNDVQSFVNGTTNNGWLIKDSNEDDSQSFWQFGSKECSSTNLRPVLIVTYTTSSASIVISPSAANICSNSNGIQLTASGANNYSWSPSIGLSSTSGTIVTANPSSTTTYTVTGTASNGSTVTKTVVVTVNSNPSLSISSNSNSVCNGNSVQLIASGANTYSWSPAIAIGSTTSNTLLANPTANTTYTVIGTDVNGCVGTATKTITVNNKPNVTVNPLSYSLIIGSSAQLQASGASTYVWSPSNDMTPNNTVSNPTVAPNSTTIYTVTGTDANGCIATASTTVTVISQSTSSCTELGNNITATIKGSCIGSSSGSIILDGLQNYSGQLSLADCSSGQLVSGTTIVVNPGEIKRIATSIANANITINGGKLIICGSVSIASLNISNHGSLINNGGCAVYSNTTIPDGCSIVNNNGSFAFYGSVTVEGFLLNLYGAMATYSTLNVTGNGEIENNSTFSNVAQGITLPNNFNDSLARTPYVIWTGTSQEGSAIGGLAPGNYTATITSGSCVITKTYTVQSTSAPQFTVTKSDNTDTICNGSLTASVTGGTAPYYYLWSDKDNHTISFADVAGNLCAGNYTLTLTDNLGCTKQGTYTIINNYNYPQDSSTNGNNGNGGNIESDVHYFGVPVFRDKKDSIAQLFKVFGSNSNWALAPYTGSYLLTGIEDTTMHNYLPTSSIMKNHFFSYGDSITETAIKHIYGNGVSGAISSTFFLKCDGSGTLQTQDSTYHNTKRIHVREINKFYCSEGCYSNDTIYLLVNNYYWFSSDTSSTPVLSYTELSKVFGMVRESYNGVVPTKTGNSTFDIDAFRRLVNLQVSPNPASTNTTIQYLLPYDAAVNLSISNSLNTAGSTIINSQQLAGQYSININLDSFTSGIYNISLIIDGIVVSKTLSIIQ